MYLSNVNSITCVVRAFSYFSPVHKWAKISKLIMVPLLFFQTINSSKVILNCTLLAYSNLMNRFPFVFVVTQIYFL